jgi:hypothetical protein
MWDNKNMKTILIAIIFLIFWRIVIGVKLYKKAWKEFEKENETSIDLIAVINVDGNRFAVVHDKSLNMIVEIPLSSDDEKLNVYDEFIDGLEM